MGLFQSSKLKDSQESWEPQVTWQLIQVAFYLGDVKWYMLWGRGDSLGAPGSEYTESGFAFRNFPSAVGAFPSRG